MLGLNGINFPQTQQPTQPAPAAAPAFNAGLLSSIIGQQNVDMGYTGMTRVDPGQAFSGDQGASELLGQLSRAQWTDWKARFAPYVDRLAEIATDGQLATKAGTQAYTAANQINNNAQRSLQMNQASYGLQLSPDEQAAQNRKFALSGAATAVQASNDARAGAVDLQQSILAGSAGLSQIPDEVLNQM